MLTQLTVSNYAIAERVELQFSKGMTALTGETGAGKSIVLDALGLAMGGRADAGAVRHGAKRADITATFDVSGIPEATEWLAEHELDDDNDCILRRVISKDGRSQDQRAFLGADHHQAGCQQQPASQLHPDPAADRPPHQSIGQNAPAQQPGHAADLDPESREAADIFLVPAQRIVEDIVKVLRHPEP